MKKILALIASAWTALAVGAAVQLTASVYDDDTGGTYTGSGVFVEVTYSWWQGEEQVKGVDDVSVTIGEYNNASYAIVRGCITNESIDRDKCKWEIALDSSNLGFAVVDANVSAEDLAAGYLTNRVVGVRADGAGTYNKAAIVLHVARRYCTLTYDANGGDDEGLPNPVEIVCGVATRLTSATPTRPGYAFGGWSKSATSTSPTYNPGASATFLDDTTLYAVWVANDYVVAFNANGGTGTMATQAMTYGTPISLSINEFTRPGYAFAGWSLTAGGKVAYTDGAAVTGIATGLGETVMLYAVWTPEEYLLTVDPNGGVYKGSSETTALSPSIKYDTKLWNNIGAATRTGYALRGYYADREGETRVYDEKGKNVAAGGYWSAAYSNGVWRCLGDLKVYALWLPVVYKVSFNANGGNGTMPAQQLTYDAKTALTLNAFTRTGFAFAGWAQSADADKASYADGAEVLNLADTANATVALYAVWEASRYYVAFAANGGKGTMNAQNATYGVETDLETNAFTRVGYAFGGWAKTPGGAAVYADGASVSNLTDVADATNTLYAVWKANDYSVAFYANGGKGKMDPQNATYGKALVLEPNTFSRTGYEFGGWKATDGSIYVDGATVSNLTTTAGAAVPLYAIWNPISYDLSFDADGGTGELAPRTVSYDDAYGDLPTPTRSGYEFVGWFDKDGKEVTKDTRAKSTSAGTLKARWASIAYNVVFDANGGEGWKEPFEAICRYGETLTLPDETFVRAGYTLDGWDCGGTNYVCGAIVSNLTTAAGGRVTFAAQWKPISYSVVFDGNGGTCETNSAPTVTNVVAYGEELEVPTFVRLGRVLNGWICANVTNAANAIVSNLTTTAGATVQMRANWNLGPNDLSEALDIDNLVFENDGGAWTVRDDADAVGGTCIGVTGDGVTNTVALATETDSGGTISFRWKFASVDYAMASFGFRLYDVTGGETLWSTNYSLNTASTNEFYAGYKPHWEQFSTNIVSDGIHKLQWEIITPNLGSDDEGILLDNVTWVPAGGAAGIAAVELPVAVPGLVYDGTEKIGVDENAAYTLVGNVATNADGYLATATLNNKAASVWADGTADDREIPWRIATKGIDFSGVAFADASWKFDGKSKSINASGVPAGVEVTYDGNNRTEVGEYTVTAWFKSSSTGNLLTNMTATLTIEALSVGVPSAVAGLVYDGTAKTGVVEGVGYTLAENVATAAGDYVATATLDAGYVWSDNTTGPKEISWSIARATYDMGDVLFEDGTFEFDGTNLYLAVEGDIPDGVDVYYLYNGKSGVGSYTVIARFTASDAVNYEPIPDLAATLTIVLPPTKIEVPTAVSGLVYDGSAKTGVVESEGYLLSGNVATNAGSYAATATLEDGYVWADGTTAAQKIQWSIAKATYDMSGVSFASKTFEADGTKKSIAITGTLPSGVKVSYVGNGQTEPGTYTVTAKFTGDANNYNSILDKKATLTITKKSDPVPPGPGPGPEPDPDPVDETPDLYPSGVAVLGAFTAEKAETYNGWLKDDAERVVALLTVKTTAAKSGKQTKSTITVTPVNGKKYTKKTSFDPGGNPTDEFGIVYGSRGLLGTFGGYSVEAGVDVYKSKISEVKALAANIPVATHTFSVDTGNGMAVFSAVIAKTGKTKVQGYLEDGAKISVYTTGALGEDYFAVPVVSPKAATRCGFVLWFPLDGGSPTLANFYDSNWTASLSGGSYAMSDGEHVFDFDEPDFRNYLASVDGFAVAPVGAVFTVKRGKWDAGKTVGRLKVIDGAPAVTGTSSPSNLSALKLTYTSKSGLVKGSFKLYYMDGKRLKNDTVTVTGVVVDGKLFGSGTIKKLGSFAVTAE